MPNKRSNRKKTQKFQCPYCEARLWRLGSQKYYLFYQGASEIQKHLKLSPKKARFLAAQNPVQVDKDTWLEEFLCQEHGKIWMRLAKKDDQTLASHLADSGDWRRTTKTVHPEIPNPSVSEYSYRLSRRANYTNLNLKYSN
jgi:hypothetical protein